MFICIDFIHRAKVLFCQNDANPSLLLIFKGKIFVFEHVLYIHMCYAILGGLKVTAISLVVQLPNGLLNNSKMLNLPDHLSDCLLIMGSMSC